MKKLALLVAINALIVLSVISAQSGPDESDYNSLLEQVNEYIGAGDYTATISLLEKMHELRPEELLPVEYLGILSTALPDEKPGFTRTLPWLLEAENRYSENSNVYYNLACIYSVKGDMEQAVRAMNRAVLFGFSDFNWMGQDEDLVNFRTMEWWQGIKGSYGDIAEQLRLFSEYVAAAQEKPPEENAEFYASIVSALGELAPPYSSLKVLSPLVFGKNS